jgi:hypothetical protein
MGTKEPQNNGDEQRATEDGSTLTGFQSLKEFSDESDLVESKACLITDHSTGPSLAR